MRSGSKSQRIDTSRDSPAPSSTTALASWKSPPENRWPRSALTSTDIRPVPTFWTVEIHVERTVVVRYWQPGRRLHRVLGHDDLEEPLPDKHIVGLLVGGERPQVSHEVLDHRVIPDPRCKCSIEGLDAGELVLTTHVIREHPAGPAHLVVGQGRIARRRSVDLDQLAFRIDHSASPGISPRAACRTRFAVRALSPARRAGSSRSSPFPRRACSRRALHPASGCSPTTGARPRGR